MNYIRILPGDKVTVELVDSFCYELVGELV